MIAFSIINKLFLIMNDTVNSFNVVVCRRSTLSQF